jgi:hypothetical protein
MTGRSTEWRRYAVRDVDWRIALLAVVACAGLYVALRLDRTWFPVDDGALAHSAERVLGGELPHRDFDDVYTGGLAYLNAAAFRMFGTSFWAMRLALFAVFVAWVPAVFYIAARFVRPVPAAAITLLAVVWSLPAYVAPMPSWYNLFLATFGLAALMRWLEDRHARWLVLAGMAGGLSVLVKVVGLYYVAGVLLFLVFQAHADAASNCVVEERTRPRAYQAFVTAALVLFGAALAALVRRAAFPSEIVHFVLPGVLLAALLVTNEWRRPAASSRRRFAGLGRLLLPFVAGIAIPVALFLVPYVRADALGDVVNGVFILPTRRFANASVRMLPLSSLLTLLLPAAILAAGRVRSATARRILPVALPLLLLALVLGTGWSTLLYRLVWSSARNLVPALALIGIVVLYRSHAAAGAMALHRLRIMLLLGVTALASLVQFPFSVAVYFCYVAPLVVLSATALYTALPPTPRVVPAALVGLYACFAVLRIDSAAQYGMGRFYLPASRVAFEPLPGGRAGVDAPHANVVEYQAVTYLLQAHATGGYTWASPDSPEVYFLSGLRNPTRTMYEFFEDSAGHTDRILRALDAHGVTAIVENLRPPFSAPLAPALVSALAARYPRAAQVGPYLVRWR